MEELLKCVSERGKEQKLPSKRRKSNEKESEGKVKGK